MKARVDRSALRLPSASQRAAGSDPGSDPSGASEIAIQSVLPSPQRPATKLGAAHAAVAARIAAGQPGRLDPVERARRHPTSFRFAIAAKCWTCMRGDLDPNGRARIRECPSTACPLFPVRPFQPRKVAT